MKTNKKLSESKKAIVLGVALLNLNAIFILSVFKPTIQISIVTQMITAILFLVGIYTGVQGGVDMIQSNKLDVVKQDINQNVKQDINVKQKYEYKMEYDVPPSSTINDIKYINGGSGGPYNAPGGQYNQFRP